MTENSADRDAYEGAREDLLYWKKRALEVSAPERRHFREATDAWKYLEDDCSTPNDGQSLKAAIESALAIAEDAAYKRGHLAGFNEANGGATFMGEPASRTSETLPVAHLRPTSQPDWLEVCRREADGAFPVYGACFAQGCNGCDNCIGGDE